MVTLCFCSSNGRPDGQDALSDRAGGDGAGLEGAAGSSGGVEAGGTGGVAPATYVCQGSGSGGAAGDSAPRTSDACVVGQTFCEIEVLRSGPPLATCRSFTDAARAADCSDRPSCACLCGDALFFHCQTECRCSEDGGQVTVICGPV